MMDGMRMKVVPRKRSCVLWDGALVFYLLENRSRSVLRAQRCLIFVKGFGGKKMNFGAEMMPGITLLVVGAFLGFFADGVCKNKKNVQPMRMLGTFLAVVGAIMVFIV